MRPSTTARIPALVIGLLITLATGSFGQNMPGMPGMSAMPDSAAAMAGVLGIPHTRLGSGTSWQPEDSPHYGWHVRRGMWSLMVHGAGFLQYDHQDGPRGDNQLALVDWAMLMAMHPLAGGMLHLHGMLSTEPATVGGQGYPLLLQSGEEYRGQPLHDRQHPHDLFMELSAIYEHQVAHDLAVSLYAAPAGEPALGPVAFPHRMSAASDPLAPLGHHWQDATHITFGVVTAGLFSRTWKVEASLFNGREPDQDRADIDLRSLSSFAVRGFYNPGPAWSMSAWYGYLASPEAAHPQESLHRLGASVLQTRPLGTGGEWSSTLIYGANAQRGVPLANSLLLESDLDLDGRNTIFGRVEYVQKSAQDLIVADTSAARRYDIGELTLGYVRELASARGVSLGAGVLGTMNVVPRALAAAYGSSTPTGVVVYLRLRPTRMRMHGMASMKEAMPGMPSD